MPLGDDISRMTRLQIKRLHLGWSRTDLALRSGISIQTIMKHEGGIRDVYVTQTILKLIGALGVEQNYLVRGYRDIWEGDGKLWRKHLRSFDRWEEIIIRPSNESPIFRSIPTRATGWSINYDWTTDTPSAN